MLVHVTAAKLEAKIRRGGLRAKGGVYAFPVLPSFTLTHQWTREILKWTRQPMIGVYFRVPDDQSVRVGRYGQIMRSLPAVRAVAEIHSHADPRGVQIIVDRAVPARAITRVSALRGVIGWRHRPGAHGSKPCGCPGCVARGEPGGRALRLRYERGEL